MRYRGYRRERKEEKDKRAKTISGFTSYSGYCCRNKMAPGSSKWDKYALDAEDADYVVRTGRARRSKHLKDEYNRKLRRSSKLKMDLFGTTKSGYKRASGDFWWEYD